MSPKCWIADNCYINPVASKALLPSILLHHYLTCPPPTMSTYDDDSKQSHRVQAEDNVWNGIGTFITLTVILSFMVRHPI
jgi:hypothetical protein